MWPWRHLARLPRSPVSLGLNPLRQFPRSLPASRKPCWHSSTPPWHRHRICPRRGHQYRLVCTLPYKNCRQFPQTLICRCRCSCRSPPPSVAVTLDFFCITITIGSTRFGNVTIRPPIRVANASVGNAILADSVVCNCLWQSSRFIRSDLPKSKWAGGMNRYV